MGFSLSSGYDCLALRGSTYAPANPSSIMKNNYLALIVFGLVLVGMTSATGHYLYATLADFFFLTAYLSYRRQKRATSQ